MKLTIRTPVSQRKVVIERAEELDSAIKEAFKLETYQIFSDQKRTIPYDLSQLKDGALIYMSYDMGTPKTVKEEFTCDHSPEAVCPKCATLDPLDRTRGENDGIKVKYLSRNSFKQLLKNNNKQEDQYNYILKKCDDHPANVTCTKCMDKVITLVPQIYRWIDYVEFDNKGSVERFLGRWRESGRQQIGFLIGRVMDHKDTPEGRKIVVSGIWEVEQESFPDGAVLERIPSNFICKELSILGLIYTSLTSKNGSLCNHRLDNDYVISTVELNFFYEVQAVVKSNDFVNICLSLDSDANISLECYMISEQFRALMFARALELTTDHKLFRTERDLTYLTRNEYGKDVSTKAKPFVPVDYFVVKCEAGYLENPLFENQVAIEKCTKKKLAGYFNGDFSMKKLSSFPILIELHKHLHITGEIMSAVIQQDEDALLRLKSTEEFGRFTAELAGMTVESWNCPACTYLNEPYNAACVICGSAK